MKFRLLLFSVVLSLGVYSQNDFPYGKIKVRSFNQKDYSANAQNWDMIQNNDHFLYFANNGGILEYNGETWNKVELNTTPRSFAKSDSGRIYVGARNEFGYIDYNELGKTIYVKISEPVDSLQFEDVWQVYCLGEHTYFVAGTHVFIYFNEELEVIDVPEAARIKRSVCIDQTLICTFEFDDAVEDQSFVLRGDKFIEISNSQAVTPIEIFIRNEKKFIIDNQGFFYEFQQNGNYYQFVKLTDKALNFGAGFKISDVQIRDNLIAIATAGNGVMLFTFEGKLLRSFMEKDGLENLEIRKIYFDQYDNLWICNDNGINFIEMSDAITSFDKDYGVTTITEDIQLKGDQIYLATHTDLFQGTSADGQSIYFDKLDIFGMELYQFKTFTFSDGSTYDLLIANDGIYYLDQQKEKHLIAAVYAWDMFQSTSNPDRILLGMDGDGLGSVLYQDGRFINEGLYARTSGEVRSVVEYKDRIYYSVKFEGIHVLDTTKNQSQNILKGLRVFADSTSDYEQYTLTVFDDKLYVGTSNGLYEVADNKLVESKLCNSLFAEEKLLVHRIINDNNERLWLVLFHNSSTEEEYSEIGYLTKEGDSTVWISSPFRQLADDVIHTIKRGKDGIFWFGGSTKVYAYNDNYKARFDMPFQSFITQVNLNQDSAYFFNAHYAKPTEHKILYAYNSIRFEFSCNAYLGALENQYSYYLEGFDNEWSKWKTSSSAEYQRLSEGDYVFHVKALNYYGYESEEVTFSFTILPPWYRTIWAYIVYFLLFILLIYIIIRLAIRRVKLQKEELEKIVQERTHEIAEQNHLLEHQKAEIEEKTNDIVDSIKYAKRIQNTILPGEDKLSKIFDHDHFVLYKPKDIVSGDFYWAARFENKSIFSAIDCTGHGVPGAFVSIVGFNALNRTVNEFKLRQPAAILDKLTELVVDTFSQSETNIKDGMDIGLCSIDNDTLKLEFSGANNPCVVIRNGEAIELKPDKQPIGEFELRKPFTNHDFQLQKGDCVYVLTDGYADQFGGPKGKKLKFKSLRDLLVEISTLDVKTQLQKLDDSFMEWKGEYEQLDDVCLFGVRIK